MLFTEILTKATSIYELLEKREIYLSQPYSLVDTDLTSDLISNLKQLLEDLHNLQEKPQLNTLESVLHFELVELSTKTIALLEEELSSKSMSPERVMQIYDVSEDDIAELKDWLLTNKIKIKQINRKQMENCSFDKLTRIDLGSSELRHEVESLMSSRIDQLLPIVSNMYSWIPEREKFFSKGKIFHATGSERSHYNKITGQVFMTVGSRVQATSSGLYFDWISFFKVLGHELLGHALNYHLTSLSTLPSFIKFSDNSLTASTRESIAEYFKHEFVRLCSINAEVRELISKDYPPEVAFQRFQDEEMLRNYDYKLIRVGYWVLSTTKQDEVKNQIDELSKYSLEPKWPIYFVNKHRNEWDTSEKRILSRVSRELKYAKDIVPRASRNFSQENIDIFKKASLTGFWTPKGYDKWIQLSTGVKL